ncbi:MAG: ribosomal-processing cysteine protease Prp [Clostridia bacterium]|nr:ribosomal-processing cysteine protease Prp [Clostridia bacterium]
MTKIDIFRKNGFIEKFKIENHTGYSDAGEDVVCAIISTASQSVIIGAEEIIGLTSFDYVITEAFLECDFSEVSEPALKEKVSILTETMMIVLSQAQEQFADYISLVEHTL